MILLRRPWPSALSLVFLVIALYFSLTNSAFVIRGCGVEDYPELGFMLIVAPAALLGLLLSFGNLKARWMSVGISLFCLISIVVVLTTAAGSGCKV